MNTIQLTIRKQIGMLNENNDPTENCKFLIGKTTSYSNLTAPLQLVQRWKLKVGKDYSLWNYKTEGRTIICHKDTTCCLVPTNKEIVIKELINLCDPDIVETIDSFENQPQCYPGITLTMIIGSIEHQKGENNVSLNRTIITGYDRSGKIRLQKWKSMRWKPGAIGQVCKFTNVGFGKGGSNAQRHKMGYTLSFGKGSTMERCNYSDLNDFAKIDTPTSMLERLELIRPELRALRQQ